MRNNHTPRFYILSAGQIEHGRDDNEAAAADLVCDLSAEDFPFREVEGYFAGFNEVSQLVVGKDAGPLVHDLASVYNQTSYIVVTENDRDAYLVDVGTGVHRHLGKWRAVGAELPAKGDWTCADGEYYQCAGPIGATLPGGL